METKKSKKIKFVRREISVNNKDGDDFTDEINYYRKVFVMKEESNMYVDYLKFVLSTEQAMDVLQFKIPTLVKIGKEREEILIIIKFVRKVQMEANSITVPKCFAEAHRLLMKSLILFKKLIHFVAEDHDYNKEKFSLHKVTP